MKKYYGVTLDVKTQYHARVVVDLEEVVADCPELEEHVKTPEAFHDAIVEGILEIGSDGGLWHGSKPVGDNRRGSSISSMYADIDRDMGADEEFGVWDVQEQDEKGEKV